MRLRNRFSTICLLIGCVVLSPGAQASSVYRISPARDWSVIGASAAVGLVPNLMARKLISFQKNLDPSSVNSLDRGVIGNHSRAAEVFTDLALGFSIVGPVVADGFILRWGQEWGEDSVVFVQTLTLSGALVTVTKYIVQRPRPRTYAGDPAFVDIPEGYTSFYSGHTATVVAALTAASMTVQYRYGEQWWPWVVTVGVGGAVALGRTLAGWHFYSDVVTGAVVGAAIGYAVPRLHRRDSILTSVTVLPTNDGGQLIWAQKF